MAPFQVVGCRVTIIEKILVIGDSVQKGNWKEPIGIIKNIPQKNHRHRWKPLRNKMVKVSSHICIGRNWNVEIYQSVENSNNNIQTSSSASPWHKSSIKSRRHRQLQHRRQNQSKFHRRAHRPARRLSATTPLSGLQSRRQSRRKIRTRWNGFSKFLTTTTSRSGTRLTFKIGRYALNSDYRNIPACGQSYKWSVYNRKLQLLQL